MYKVQAQFDMGSEKNQKTVCEKCYRFGWKSNPSNAKWADPHKQCLGAVFAVSHIGCKLEPWLDPCRGNPFDSTLP